MSNYYKDQEEESEKLKILCRFINPDAARKIFDREIDEVLSEADDKEFMKEVQEPTSSNVTLDDVNQAFDKKHQGLSIQDLDVIELVKE